MPWPGMNKYVTLRLCVDFGGKEKLPRAISARCSVHAPVVSCVAILDGDTILLGTPFDLKMLVVI